MTDQKEGNNMKSSQSISVRIPTTTYNYLKEKARKEYRSLNQQIMLYIDKAIEQKKADEGESDIYERI